MAHFINIIKATTLKRKLLRYVKEKEVAINEYELDYESPKIKKVHKSEIKGWWLARFINNILTPNTIHSVVFNSVIGFFGGVLLTYIFFCFFYVGVNYSLRNTTYICVVAGIVLCLGLAFSSKVRCYVLLLIPVFFSKQGRQAILTYALFLAFTGPARNTMQNMRILSDSMTCGQEMVKRTLKQLIEMVKAPFRSIKETIQKIKKSLEEVVESIKSFVMKIKRIIVSILKVIKVATSWLGSIVNFCNKKVGTPFQRCMKTLDDAIADCKAKMGVMSFLCHVVHVVKGLCYTVKWLDFICLFTEFVSEKIIGVVKKKLREFTLHMKNLFYVSIEFSHSYEFETKASNTTKEVAKTILQKLSDKVEIVQKFFSFCGFMFSFIFLFVFFKVYYYRYKYLSSDRFDNVYISKYIIDLDIRRAQMDRETVLPLERREKSKFGKPTTIRLLKDEKIRVTRSIFLLTLTSFKIITFLVIDYSLYWVLFTIYEVGRVEFEEVEKAKFGVRVQGLGVLAKFYQSLGNSFQVPENPNLKLTPLHCLPDPVEPDFGRYTQIGFLVSICWVLTVTEAYGLRLRNVVMSHYYPDRARERAVWLYNHILQSRGSFLRYARRQLRRKFGLAGKKPIEKVTLTQRLFAGFPLLGALFGKKNENNCLLCGTPGNEKFPLKRCKTPDCPGRYCLQCFANLENVCTVCQHPIEYGDVSDISEEVDSSEEDLYKRNPTREYDSDELQEHNKFKTFKEMETRERFRDVEAQRIPDYVKLGDLFQDKAALQARLKKVIDKHIQNMERVKNERAEIKRSQYQKLKNKLQDLMITLKGKKTDEVKAKKLELRNRVKEKINYLKKLKENKEYEYENLLGESPKVSKTRVKFKTEESNVNYKNLKNVVRKRIMALKKVQEKGESSKYEELNEDSSD